MSALGPPVIGSKLAATLNLDGGAVAVPYWSHFSHRRFVETGDDYGSSKELLSRFLRRFQGGRQQYEFLQRGLMPLACPGQSVMVGLDSRHYLGLVRPWRVAGVELGERPWLICKELRRRPYAAIMVPDLDQGRALVRSMREQGVSPVDWVTYRGEQLASPIERLFTAGPNHLRTELETELVGTFGSAGQARQRLPFGEPSLEEELQVAA